MSTIKRMLIASLCINVIALGAIIGHVAMRPPHAPSGRSMMQAVIASLPEGKQASARAAYKNARLQNKESFAQEAAIRQQYIDSLRAKTFDEAAFDDAAAQLHALRGAMVGHMQAATKAVARGLNQNERVALADALEHAMRAHKGGQRGGKRPPPPSRRD